MSISTLNPEFRRQLWLQFSASRLVVTPIFLAVVMAGIYWMSDDAKSAYTSIAITASFLFTFISLGMGASAARASIVDEVNEHTWDQQRMNAMTPWSMTWGKLIGSTSFAWYCGAWCLLVAHPAAVLVAWADIPVWHFTAIGILLSLLVQTVVMTIQLQSVQAKNKNIKRGSLPIMTVAIVWIAIYVFANSSQSGLQMQWWGYAFERVNFILLSLVLFAVTALVMAWRSMAEALLVRQWPWGWPMLALLISTYITGFAPEQRSMVWCATALVTSVGLTYLALLADTPSFPQWKRIVTRLELGQWKITLQSLPRWTSTLFLSFPLALLVMSLPTIDSLYLRQAWGLQEIPTEVGLHAMVVWLILLRDAALALGIGFTTERHRRTLSFVVVMMVLHGLLPWLMNGLLTEPGKKLLLRTFFAPLLTPTPFTIVVALVQAGLALLFLFRRWRAAAV